MEYVLLVAIVVGAIYIAVRGFLGSVKGMKVPLGRAGSSAAGLSTGYMFYGGGDGGTGDGGGDGGGDGDCGGGDGG